MIYRARHVVPVIGPPIENGAVVVKGDTIAAVGPWDGIRPAWAGEAEDLGDAILMPGLINAHCHLDYSGLRGAILRPESFAGWIQRINAVKRNLSEDDFLAAIEKGLAECLNSGTTTVLNIESFPGLLPRMRRPSLRTWWFFEMIDLRQTPPADEIISAALKFFAQRPEWRGGVGLSPHAPYTASIELYLLTRAIARRHGLPVTTHVGESYEEQTMFADGAGPLFSFLQSIGRPMADCGNGRSPLRVLADAAAIGPETILAHLNELPVEDEDLLRPGGFLHDVAVVHCPLSHRYFSHRPFPLERLRKLDINVCLGTDSLASNQTLSIFEEMRAAREAFPFLTSTELLEMATINGARALGLAGRLGVLRPGAFADLIALRGGDSPDLATRIVEHRGNVDWAMVGGTPARFGAA
jgi:aminodeoxyfutalosine deaminase